MPEPGLLMLAAALGLLGFVEPCTLGAHMIFLRAQEGQPASRKLAVMTAFAVSRSMAAGAFGLLFALLGKGMTDVQTSLWVVFGAIYVLIGMAILMDIASRLQRSIDIVPQGWKRANNPFTLGLAFGLNIPACAAPILFGLLGAAATGQVMSTGFITMATFGLFLSAPLLLFILIPEWSERLGTLVQKFGSSQKIVGLLFVAVGIWAIWFAFAVEPENWAQ